MNGERDLPPPRDFDPMDGFIMAYAAMTLVTIALLFAP